MSERKRMSEEWESESKRMSEEWVRARKRRREIVLSVLGLVLLLYTTVQLVFYTATHTPEHHHRARRALGECMCVYVFAFISAFKLHSCVYLPRDVN